MMWSLLVTMACADTDGEQVGQVEQLSKAAEVAAQVAETSAKLDDLIAALEAAAAEVGTETPVVADESAVGPPAPTVTEDTAPPEESPSAG